MASFFKQAKALGVSTDFAKSIKTEKRFNELLQSINRFKGNVDAAEYVLYASKKGADVGEYFTKKEMKEFKKVIQKETNGTLKGLTTLEKYDLTDLINESPKNWGEVMSSLLSGKVNSRSNAKTPRQKEWADFSRFRRGKRTNFPKKMVKEIAKINKDKGFKPDADYGYAVAYHMRTKGLTVEQASTIVVLGRLDIDGQVVARSR